MTVNENSVQAVAQFVALMHARDRADADRMRVARTELARLGVRVGFSAAEPGRRPGKATTVGGAE